MAKVSRTPAVSVVVPTRNRCRLLLTTMTAILEQRDVDLELLVVDEASGDSTPDALRTLADPRVRVLRNEQPLGVARARNRGLAAARGSWVGFCDDDDVWAPDKLARQIDAAETGGLGWALGGVVWFTTAAGVTPVATPSAAEITAGLPSVNLVPGGCSNAIVRREIAVAAGGFDPKLRMFADWDLWIRLARTGPPAVVDDPVLAYRLHAGNMSTNTHGVLAELRLLEEKSADLREGPLDAGWVHRWMGRAARRGGDRRGAAAAFLRATSPRDASAPIRTAAVLVAPDLGWRIARKVKRSKPLDLAPAPEWLVTLLAVEDAADPGPS